MKHLQVKLTPNQQKMCESLLYNIDSIDGGYKSFIKLTTDRHILYFEDGLQETVSDAILTTKIRGCKAFADKIRKL